MSEANVALIQVHDSRGRLLLGKRRDGGKGGAWTLPGGHFEEGETPDEAAARELLEETGMTPESLTLQRVVEPVDGRPRLYCFTALCIGEPHGANDPDQEVEKWEWVDIEDGIPEKFWENLTGPPGDDNIVRQAYEPEDKTSADDDNNRQDVSKSEDDLLKFQPTPVFPKLGVPEDRRETPIVDTSAELRSKARAMIASEPLRSGDDAETRDMRGRMEFNRPSAGVVSTNPAYTTGYSLSNARRDIAGMTDTQYGDSGKAHTQPNAPMATQLHENWHQVMNRVSKIHGHQKRAYLARNLYLSIPDAERTYTDWWTNLRNQRAAHGNNPFHPHHYEEKIAVLLNYLNHPGERDAYHNFLDHSPEERVKFGRNIKRAMKHLRTTAANADESWLDPSMHPLTYAERNSPYRPSEPRPTMSKPAPQPTKPQVQRQPTPKKPPEVDPRQQKLFEKAEPTYADYLEEPDTNILEDDLLQKMAVADIPPAPGTPTTDPDFPGHAVTEHDYSHVLRPEHRDAGMKLLLTDRVIPGFPGAHSVKTTVQGPTGGWIGGIDGVVDKGNEVRILESNVSTPHRGKGLGQAMYEALYAHALHNHGVKRAAGGLHSTAADLVHRKLAEKHGLTYVPKAGRRRNQEGDYDKRFGHYSYTLKSEGDPLIIQGYGMPGTYFEGEPCMYDSAEDCPDIDCSHHAELTPAKDPTDDPNGGQIESEVQALLRHPDPMERCLALKLASCSADDVTTAAFDSEPAVWQAALQHELAGPAHAAIAASTSGPSGVIFPQHDHLLAQGDLSPEILEAMHHAVSGDPSLLEGTRQDRLSRIASHPNFGAETMAKHDAASARHIYRSSTQPDLAPADASGETTMPHLRHLEEAYRHHAPTAPPMLGKLWSGGQSSKEVYNLPVAGHAEPRRFMVKPYSEFDSPLSGWAEGTSQALYHAAGIGHLHQQSFVAPHGTGDSLVPATVIHLEDGELAGKEPPDQIRAKNPQLHDELRKIALMDLLTANTDRAPRNLIVRPNGKPLAIDHALAFERGLKPTAHAYLQRAGGIMAVDGSAAIPSAYRETYKWWPTVAPQIRKAFADRLKLIRDQDVRAGSIRKLFEGRARWLDAAAKTAEAGQDPDVSARLESHRQLPWESGPDLSKKIDETHFVEGAAKMPLGHALENSGEHFAGKHPAAVAPKAAAFETNIMKAPHKVEPNFKQRGGADNSMGIEPKQVFHTPGGRFMVKAFHSKLAPYTGWGESVSQDLYHAGGIGHLHQGSHVTPGESGEHGLVVHMAEGHTPMSQVTGAIPETTMKSLRQISLMDHLQGNTDRHADNLMLNNATGQPLAIDNGLAHNIHHRYASGRVSNFHANTPDTGEGTKLHFAPDAETWKWWQTAKEPVRKKFEEHLQSVTDPEYKERLRASFMHRFNNLQGALQAPWWKRAKAALVGPAAPNPVGSQAATGR